MTNWAICKREGQWKVYTSEGIYCGHFKTHATAILWASNPDKRTEFYHILFGINPPWQGDWGANE